MITTYDKNFRTPLNTADTRKIYSFSRGQRFTKTRQFDCKRSFYDAERNNSGRSTSFGIGKRSSITNNKNVPSPGDYEDNSPSKLKKGFTFANNKKICFFDERAAKSSVNPGPGKYESTFFQKKYSFSMRSKYEDPLHRQKLKLGPGQYNLTDQLNQKGNYQQSKHRNSCCGKIGKEKRFGGDETLAPGPGKYPIQLAIDPIGNYFNSRIPSKGIHSFAGPSRDKLFLVGENPGPGSYYIFPEFPSTSR